MKAQLAKEAKWRIDQETQNRAREERIEKQMEADNAERARRLALGEIDNDVFQNASTKAAKEC